MNMVSFLGFENIISHLSGCFQPSRYNFVITINLFCRRPTFCVCSKANHTYMFWFRASSHELILVHWPAFWTDILLSFQPSSTQGLCDIIPLVHLAKFLLVGEPGSAIDQEQCYWKRIWPFPNRVLTKWCTWIATFLHRCWANYHSASATRASLTRCVISNLRPSFRKKNTYIIPIIPQKFSHLMNFS